MALNLHFEVILRRFEVVFWCMEWECCTSEETDENSFQSTNWYNILALYNAFNACYGTSNQMYAPDYCYLSTCLAVTSHTLHSKMHHTSTVQFALLSMPHIHWAMSNTYWAHKHYGIQSWATYAIRLSRIKQDIEHRCSFNLRTKSSLRLNLTFKYQHLLYKSPRGLNAHLNWRKLPVVHLGVCHQLEKLLGPSPGPPWGHVYHLNNSEPPTPKDVFWIRWNSYFLGPLPSPNPLPPPRAHWGHPGNCHEQL